MAQVQLRDAANYLELHEVKQKVSDELERFLLKSTCEDGIMEDLACICAILQELMVREGSGGHLWMICLDLLEEHTEACFLPKDSKLNKGICACSFAVLEKIFHFA